MSGQPEPLVFFTDRDLGKRFASILAEAGVEVRRHADLFPADCPDEQWLAAVAANGWIAVTHDKRIRYKPNEKKAVLAHAVRLCAANHAAPWIAKVYRPSVGVTGKAPGNISLWLQGRV